MHAEAPDRRLREHFLEALLTGGSAGGDAPTTHSYCCRAPTAYDWLI
jgi:hypothetical protein